MNWMRMTFVLWTLCLCFAVTACGNKQYQTGDAGTSQPAQAAETATKASPFDKPGFITSVEDGRLWVLRPGQEKSNNSVTLIGQGPQGMSVRALDRETAVEYIANKPGFNVTYEDGRLWVLKPGQEKSNNNVTLIGQGPMGMSVRALDRETAVEYIASKPGFNVTYDNGRLWVLKPGQEKSNNNVTLIGQGPMGLSVRGLDRETLDEYLAQ